MLADLNLLKALLALKAQRSPSIEAVVRLGPQRSSFQVFQILVSGTHGVYAYIQAL